MTDKPLTDADLEHFYQFGHVIVRNAFSKQTAKAAVDEAFDRIGYDQTDPTTWAEGKLHLASTHHDPMGEFSSIAWAAVCQLLGGEDRIRQPYAVGNGYIVNVGFKKDEPWSSPAEQTWGWHKDGDFFRHFLDSPEQGLLTLICYSDMVHQGGATFIARDSVPVVAKYLFENPQGLLPQEMKWAEKINECHDRAEAVAEAGDIILLHPYMLHASSGNVNQSIRVVTNPPVALKEPMQFDRENPDEFSPVEIAILRSLGVERLDCQIQGQRETFVGGSAAERQRRLTDEEKRLEQAS